MKMAKALTAVSKFVLNKNTTSLPTIDFVLREHQVRSSMDTMAMQNQRLLDHSLYIFTRMTT
jgi:hypothetical protein